MTAFAQLRRRVLRRRRIPAAIAFASVGVAYALFVVVPRVFAGDPRCYGGPSVVASRPICAGLALMVSVIIVPVGALLPSVLLARRWLRARARRTPPRRVAPMEAEVGVRGGGPSRSAFRVRVPSRRRRFAAWALVFLPGVATWIARHHFYAEVDDMFGLQRVLGALAILLAWWLLEESRFRLRTLALVAPALLIEHWNALAWMFTITGWSIFGFAP